MTTLLVLVTNLPFYCFLSKKRHNNKGSFSQRIHRQSLSRRWGMNQRMSLQEESVRKSKKEEEGNDQRFCCFIQRVLRSEHYFSFTSLPLFCIKGSLKRWAREKRHTSKAQRKRERRKCWEMQQVLKKGRDPFKSMKETAWSQEKKERERQGKTGKEKRRSRGERKT